MTSLDVELGAIAEIVMGMSPPGASYNRAGIGMPLLNGPTEFGDSHPTPVLFTSDARRTARTRDILFCVRGSTTGRMNWAEQPYAIGRGIAAIRGKEGTSTRFIQACIEASLPALLQRAGGSTFPNLSFRDLATFPMPRIEPAAQRKIASILLAYADLTETNRRRMTFLEEMAQRIYREWFVDRRYPGHENLALVGSELGPIPEGWAVRRVSELAGNPRAVASGPFGSKLGRGDYRPTGTPVIRGVNLSLGGGFRDTGFVFVSARKTEELATSLAGPGDVIVTQRGTLGQVGVIPRDSTYPRYVLSQSQMKVTVDPACATSAYVYAALRSAEVTDRVKNMAISAGVPHINLTMLRDLRLISPPLALQQRFEQMVQPMTLAEHKLKQSNEVLAATRQVLLPRLVSSEIDVDDLDIAVAEAAA